MDFLNSRVLQPIASVFENKTVTVVASMLLALYAGLAAPSLPNSVIVFFDSLAGRLLFIFLIAFVASQNVQVALMIAVAYVLILHVLNQRYAENFANYRLKEHFEDAKKDASPEKKETPTDNKHTNSLEVALSTPNPSSMNVKTALCSWYNNLSELTTPKKSDVADKPAGQALADHADDIAKSGANVTATVVQEESHSQEYKDKKVKDVCDEHQSVSQALAGTAEGFYNFDEVAPNDLSASYSPAEF